MADDGSVWHGIVGTVVVLGALMAGAVGAPAGASEMRNPRPLVLAQTQSRLRRWEQEDYLVQAQFALINLDRHMARLAWRAPRREVPGRCSFQEARRGYEARAGALRAQLRQGSYPSRSAIPGRTEIEIALKETRAAFEQALACYR